MTISNPYIQNLVDMGYDETDCYVSISDRNVAEYPRTIHGRTFETKEEYDEAIAEFMMSLWLTLIMRIALSAIIILLGANILISILDSPLIDNIEQRNERIQQQIDSM